jgi:hypothetical protein
MRIAKNFLGIVFVLIGAVWILQGINIIPGSFMTGQMKWAVIGGVMLILGIIMLATGNKRTL